MGSVQITVFESDAGTTSEYSFDSSPVRIGRNPLNDLTLPFPFVSGWHAVVRFDERGAKFFDLGSTNGTLHNGRRIAAGESVAVGDGLSLTIGKVELRIRQAQASQPAHVPGHPPMGPAYPAPLAPMPEQDAPRSGGTMPSGVPPTGAFPQAAWSPPAPMHPQGPSPTPAGPEAVASGTIDSNRRPAEAGPEGTAHVEVSDVHQLVNRLRPIYQAYEQSSRSMTQELSAAVAPMPPHLHGFALSILAREFPELVAHPRFRELQAQAGLRPTDRGPVGSGSGKDLASVQRLARSLRVEEEPPRSPQEADRFLSCVEDVLRAAAKAVVELQKGQEQFGNEMGVRTIKEYTALHAAGTPENVLRYLLDWQSGGPHRTKELVGIYADLMIHQVALINGVMEGVRSLLARLAPEEIERGVGSGFGKASAAWKAYAERYAELCEEDKKLAQTIFGPEFARAYAEVGGEGG